MTAVDALRLVIAERAGGESRPQQQEMVKAVEAAIRDQTHLLVQAGTGTGKSVGYLIPAILYAVRMNRRVIVSTGTKSLSD